MPAAREPHAGTGEPLPGTAIILRVALASPLRRCFDYLAPRGCTCPPEPGVRVRIPFGRTTRIGMVVETGSRSALPTARLKHADQILDAEPLFPPDSFALLVWAASYFHHPLGEVLFHALPRLLRIGRAPDARARRNWRATPAGAALLAGDALARAPRQAALLSRLHAAGPQGLTPAALSDAHGDWRGAARALGAKGLVERVAPDRVVTSTTSRHELHAPNDAQRAAIEVLLGARGTFQPFALNGVTGSGKTEVYLHIIERVLAGGDQVLLLVPEIGLTPQIVARFRAALGVEIALLHSGLSDGARLDAWSRARAGAAPVVIGTRSAVFAPLRRLGLVIVDEEHDPSFKQQEGFRYCARDLAVIRAQRAAVPVILGSATLSIETIANVRAGRYRELTLTRRAAGAAVPRVEVVDVRARRLEGGLSKVLIEALAGCLAAGEQALLFLNRRGYAPALMCHACGWHARCARCDANLVHHRAEHTLICHHCAASEPVPVACPQCQGAVRGVGVGTERLDEALARRFPAARIQRVDRDSTRRKGALEAALTAIRERRCDILVGTQMLAKGHHFPYVTLVGIVDADGGLFSADFRGPERMAQLMVQVAGRAGRAERAGRVMIQTHQPEHPLLVTLIRAGYGRFAERALAEREAAALPPVVHWALLRAEAPRREAAQRFAAAAHHAACGMAVPGVTVSGPVPAPMERRAGRYRVQVLVEARTRGTLHRMLDRWLARLEDLRDARRVRWSIDVDPIELY